MRIKLTTFSELAVPAKNSLLSFLSPNIRYISPTSITSKAVSLVSWDNKTDEIFSQLNSLNEPNLYAVVIDVMHDLSKYLRGYVMDGNWIHIVLFVISLAEMIPKHSRKVFAAAGKENLKRTT